MLAVIIPVYKSKGNLPMLLNTLVAQTNSHFFTILVSDCDGEDYSDIIETYTARGLHMSLIERETNGGPGLARQTGINAAQMCDYFTFCDADDYVTPNFCEQLYKTAKKNFADIVVTDIILDSDTQPDQLIEKSKTITWLHGNCYSRDFLNRYNIRFTPIIKWNEDVYFNLLAFNYAKKIVHAPGHLYYWHSNPNSVTRAGTKDDVFFIKAFPDFFLSQLEAIGRLLDDKIIKNPEKKFGSTFDFLYSIYQKALILDIDTRKIIKYLNEWARKHYDFIFEFAKFENIKERALKAPQYILVKNELRQCPFSFIGWFETFFVKCDIDHIYNTVEVKKTDENSNH